MSKDIHINPDDTTSTKLATVTECCGGYHQTIAGALLNSKAWKLWYEHAINNQLFDVDETRETDAMSDRHFEAFIKFIKSHA